MRNNDIDQDKFDRAVTWIGVIVFCVLFSLAKGWL
jgi:hypothetical protein